MKCDRAKVERELVRQKAMWAELKRSLVAVVAVMGRMYERTGKEIYKTYWEAQSEVLSRMEEIERENASGERCGL